MDQLTKNKFTSKKLLNYRVELFGFAAIWIVLFHIFSYMDFPLSNIIFKGIRGLLSVGNSGVDMFLFFSSVGLCYSLQKNTIKQYYINRIKRVLIPYCIVALLFFVWYDFFFLRDGVFQFILNLSTINYGLHGNHPTWYVAFIFIAYLVFPVLYFADKKTKHITTVLLLVFSIIFEIVAMYLNLAIYVNCERALSRIPIFLIGILLFNLINKDFNICIIIPIASIIFGGGIILLIILISPHIIIIRYLYGILSLCIILFYSWIRHIGGFKFIKVLFIFCGNASFEIYIIHVFALRILNSYDLWSNLQSWAWFLIIIVSSVILGYGYNYFVKKMEVFLNGKKDNYWNNNG